MNKERFVRIIYTNYKGETSCRTIQPKNILFGFNKWHPDPQWLMQAHDVEKGEDRFFAVRDIQSWEAVR